MLQFNRRLTNGLQFQASYTEARATDNGQSSQTFTSGNNVLNPFELGLEEGTSNFEIRHRFVANAIWMSDRRRRRHDGAHAPVGIHDRAGIPGFLGRALHGDADGELSDRRLSQPAFFGPAAPTACPRSSATHIIFRARRTWISGSARAFELGGGHRIEVLLDIFNLFNRLNYTSAAEPDLYRRRFDCKRRRSRHVP